MAPSYGSGVLPQQLEVASCLQTPICFLGHQGNLRAAIRSHHFQSLPVRWANEALSVVPSRNSRDTTDLGQQLSNLTAHITALKKKKKERKDLGKKKILEAQANSSFISWKRGRGTALSHWVHRLVWRVIVSAATHFTFLILKNKYIKDCILHIWQHCTHLFTVCFAYGDL